MCTGKRSQVYERKDENQGVAGLADSAEGGENPPYGKWPVCSGRTPNRPDRGDTSEGKEENKKNDPITPGAEKRDG